MSREEKNKFGNFVHEQRKKEDEILEICQDIFRNSRNELAVSMHFFQSALSGLKVVPSAETQVRPLRSLVILERGGRRNSRRASVYHSTAKHDLYSRPGNTVLYGWPRNILRRIYIRLLDGTSDCDPFWASVHDKQKWNQPEPFKWEKLGLLRPARERIAALRQGYPFSLYPLRLQAAGGTIVFSHTQSQG